MQTYESTKSAVCQHVHPFRVSLSCGRSRPSGSSAVGHHMPPGYGRTLLSLESNPLPKPNIDMLHIRSKPIVASLTHSLTLVQDSPSPALAVYRLSMPCAAPMGMRHAQRGPRACQSTEHRTTRFTTARRALILLARSATQSARYGGPTSLSASIQLLARPSPPNVRHAEERHLDRRSVQYNNTDTRQQALVGLTHTFH